MGDTENRGNLFEEEGKVISGEEIQMGEVVDNEGLVVEPLEVDKEQAPTAFMKDAFLEHIGDGVPYLVFNKTDLLHFVKNAAFQAKTGFETHALSFKINLENIEAEGKAKLVYNNGLTMCISDVVCDMENGFGSCTVGIDSIVKSFVSSEGALYLYKDKDGDVYSYVFGGDVFVETFDMFGDDVTSDEKIMELLSPKPQEEHVLYSSAIGVFSDILPLVKLGKRPEERAAYFVDGRGYLYSGQVSAEFTGIGFNLVLQEFDLETCVNFLSGVVDHIEIAMHDSFVTYRSGGRVLFLTKRTIELDDSVKYLDSGTPSVKVDGHSLTRVLNFLASMQGVSDNITLFGSIDGLYVDSPIAGKDGKHSKFPLECMEGDVSKFKPVVLGLTGFRGFIRPLEEALDMSIARECLDRAVSPGQVTADAVLQRVIGGEEVITLSDERMELVDFIARPGAKIIGKTISKELPKDSLAGFVIRDGIPLVPAEDFKAAVGDRIFVMSMPQVVSKVKKLFVT